MDKQNNNYYDRFVRQGRSANFTDDQIDFLWDWLLQLAEDPKIFLHEDNYSSNQTPKDEA